MRVGTKYRFLDYTSILETQSNLFIYEFSNSFWWNIKSVLFEEFIFRGALLYIIMQKLRKKRGCFFCYLFWYLSLVFLWIIWKFHTNDSYLFSNRIHWSCLGLCFSKTKSMLLPIGLHLGWNFTLNQIFSKGPLGNQLFIPVKALTMYSS